MDKEEFIKKWKESGIEEACDVHPLLRSLDDEVSHEVFVKVSRILNAYDEFAKEVDDIAEYSEPNSQIKTCLVNLHRRFQEINHNPEEYLVDEGMSPQLAKHFEHIDSLGTEEEVLEYMKRNGIWSESNEL